MSTKGLYIECPSCKTRHLPVTVCRGDCSIDITREGVHSSTCVNCGHFFKFKYLALPASSVTFTVNGRTYTVGNEYRPSTALNGWLREKRVSMGTKNMCNEGGCGVCLVEVKLYEPASGKKQSYAVNSCLVPLYACDGWEISTVEHMGSVHSGLHPIQTQIARYNGTQCGYCTPGQVMNMYALVNQYGSNLTKQLVEDSFDGVLCRCTGYRPILSAFKDMASTSTCCNEPRDIEDIRGGLCETTGDRCTGRCHPVPPSRGLHVVFANTQWFRPTTTGEITALLEQFSGKTIRLLFGNTSTGVYGDQSPDNFDVVIDIAGVTALYHSTLTPDITVGANMTLSNLVDIFNRGSAEQGLVFLKDCADLLSRVANLPVRNRATWSGNICMKHTHPEFPSDVFVVLQVLNAGISIGFDGGVVSISDFLTTDLRNKVITTFTCKTPDNDEIIKFYKVMPRQQNAHAYVTGGFRIQADKEAGFLVKSQPVMAYAGVGKMFNRATRTEVYLNGKRLEDEAVLQKALSILKSEIIADVSPVLSSVEYRTSLALSLFYKFVLHVMGPHAGTRLQTGATDLYLGRPVSSGIQTYDTNKLEWPVTEPLQKLEANAQATGEVMYVDDIPPYPGTLEAAFVLSTVGSGKLGSIDATEALKIPGVVKVITATDIKGVNNFCMPMFLPEEVLVSRDVLYHGQPVALIVAESFGVALAARSAVRVSYTDVQPPIVDLEEAIQKKSFFPKPCNDLIVGNADAAIANSPKKLSGTISTGTQYHFHMETQLAQWLLLENKVPSASGTPISYAVVSPDKLEKPLPPCTFHLLDFSK